MTGFPFRVDSVDRCCNAIGVLCAKDAQFIVNIRAEDVSQFAIGDEDGCLANSPVIDGDTAEEF